MGGWGWGVQNMRFTIDDRVTSNAGTPSLCVKKSSRATLYLTITHFSAKQDLPYWYIDEIVGQNRIDSVIPTRMLFEYLRSYQAGALLSPYL